MKSTHRNDAEIASQVHTHTHTQEIGIKSRKSKAKTSAFLFFTTFGK